MASDDPEPPQATLRDEKLYIEGEKEPYFRDPKHAIWLRIGALAIQRGYQLEHRLQAGGKELSENLRGIAKLEGRDRFAVIGLETDRKTPIEFHLQSVPDSEAEFHWRANIGFRTHHWESLWEEGFWISAFCTRPYLDDLLTAVRRGHVHNIRVCMTTTMWTKDKASIVDIPRTWHIAPKPNHLEYGYISSLTWEEKFGLQPTKETEDETTASKLQAVELPARLYSMLSVLIAIGVLLLLLIFLRR
jgi:hypothetical protein